MIGSASIDDCAACVPLATRDSIWRRAVCRRLGRLTGDRLQLVDNGEQFEFGATGSGEQGSLSAELRVLNDQFYRTSALGGTLGAAESYLAGDWECDHLCDLFRIFLRNAEAMSDLDRGLARLAIRAAEWTHRFRPNTRRGSRRNIAAHYDLGNDFFARFLDSTMTYSCGYFADEGVSLEAASHAKYERLCDALDLQPSDHLLEIGGGWGGLAQFAAERYGCRVTTTTISAAQFEYAQQRIDNAGLGGQVTLLPLDYRDLEGRYDKLISIEMIEAVGAQFLPRYFSACFERLKPGGLFALQAITIPDSRYNAYRKSADFIQRYVFPGGMLPSLGALVDAASRHADFQWLRLDDLAPHYAQTLACWDARFRHQLPAIRLLGVPERLIRIWQYYFAYCEAGFRERMTGLAQILLRRPD